MSEWVSVREIAEYAGVSRQTAYRWVRAGVIPSHRFEGVWRVSRQAFDAWCEAAKQ